MSATAVINSLFGPLSIASRTPSVSFKNRRPFYVDGTNGNDGRDGLSPNNALKTIGQAVSRLQAGDTVIIAPGTYVEAVTIGALDNITFLNGAVHGNSKRVAIAPSTSTTKALDIGDANRFRAYGIRFVGKGDVGVQTSAEGSLWEDCDFTSDTTHGMQMYGRDSASFTSSGAILRRCLFRECGGAGLHLKQGAGGAVGLYATNVIVNGCQFYLNTDDDINDDAPGGALAAFSQWEISDNRFMTVDKTTYLDLNGTTGGTECQVSGNRFSVTVNTNYATQFQMPAASTGGFVGNYSSIGVIDGHTF